MKEQFYRIALNCELLMGPLREVLRPEKFEREDPLKKFLGSDVPPRQRAGSFYRLLRGRLIVRFSGPLCPPTFSLRLEVPEP